MHFNCLIFQLLNDIKARFLDISWDIYIWGLIFRIKPLILWLIFEQHEQTEQTKQIAINNGAESNTNFKFLLWNNR